jgi:Flp pilus assembly protein TadG
MLRRHGPAESGAILVFTAVLLLVLVGFAALAVDLGNAWSTNRESQTAADIAATSGLFAIPRTFNDSMGAPAPKVTAAVQAEIDDLMATNAPAGTAAGIVSADALDLTVDVTVPSNNSFGRAIGAGDVINVGTTASGHIEILPYDMLRPFAMFNTPDQPFQCVLVDVPNLTNRPRVCNDDFNSNGLEVDIVRMFALDPISCTDRTVQNLLVGVDHLIDTDAAVRSEADACVYGHILTMPNTAATYVPTTAQLTAGLIGGGGPLAGASAPLWDLLVDNIVGVCNDATIGGLATVEEQSIAMRACLRSGDADFKQGVTSSPRFSWAIRTSASFGTRHFDDVTLMFLNSLVSNDPSLTPEQAQTLNAPLAGGQVGAVTLYELNANDLHPADRAALLEPIGIDYLEFSLTN